MKSVLYTDGGAWPNPGPGAWAFALVIASDDYDPVEGNALLHPGVVVWGSAKDTTNNQMELQAAFRGLRYLSRTQVARTYPMVVVTDSLYLKNGATRERSSATHIPNADLWEQIWFYQAMLKPEWIHVRGHQGVPGNELVDKHCTIAQKSGPKEGSIRWN